MIKLETECIECIHKNICINKDKAESAMNIFANTPYKQDISFIDSNYSWRNMTDDYNINVAFSCPNFWKNSMKQDEQIYRTPFGIETEDRR